jgi:hypothetical protein
MGKLGLNSGYIGSDQRTTTNGVVGYDKFYLERINGKFRPLISGLLLNDYPGASTAYSLRLLNGAYDGSVIKVRRSSDNTEQNIGFNNNNLDTGSLLSFVGAGDGFVTTWYDQSGNGRNAVQTTAANQPQIVNGGVVITQGTKPALQFDGSNDIMTYTDNGVLNSIRTGAFTYIGVITNTRTTNLLWDAALHLASSATDGQGALGMQFTGSGEPIMNFHNSWLFPTSIASINITPILTNPLLVFQTRNGSGTGGGNNATVTNNINNLSSTQTQTWVANTGSRLMIGNQSPVPSISVNCWSGSIQELVTYPSDQSPIRLELSSNINTYYLIY